MSIQHERTNEQVCFPGQLFPENHSPRFELPGMAFDPVVAVGQPFRVDRVIGLPLAVGLRISFGGLRSGTGDNPPHPTSSSAQGVRRIPRRLRPPLRHRREVGSAVSALPPTRQGRQGRQVVRRVSRQGRCQPDLGAVPRTRSQPMPTNPKTPPRHRGRR